MSTSLFTYYVKTRSTSYLRFFFEQVVFIFLQPIPSIVGVIIRFFIYRFLINTKGFYGIEENITITHAHNLFLYKNAYIGKNSYIGASGKGIHIGENTIILDNAYISIFRFNEDSDSEVRIGNECSISSGVTIHGHNGVVIGDGTIFGPRCTIVTGNHGFISKSTQYRTASIPKQNGVVIGNNVWVGAGCTFLPSVQVGNGAVIGAGSVITKNVPAYTVVAGVPAKIIRPIE